MMAFKMRIALYFDNWPSVSRGVDNKRVGVLVGIYCVSCLVVL